MPTPAIVKGSDHFFNVLYEGNGGGQRVGKFVPFTDNGTIDKSCIFDSASSGRMNRDFTSAGTNTKKCTLSFWFKLGTNTTASGNLISAWGGTGYLFQIFKYADNHGSYPSSLMFQHYDGGSYNSQIRPNRTFEDRSKFYHCLYVWDSTESTDSNRIKIYIDGNQITSFSTSSYPSQNDDFVLTDKQSSDNTTVALGTNASQIGGTENQFYDGYLAEVNIVDGSALGPSTFGLTDSSTGRWIPKSLSGITYGSNGARLTFANTAGLTIGDDTSGNTNDFTISNIATTDITTDSPTQNHTTLNPIKNSNITLSEGNLRSATVSGAQGYVSGSDIPLTSGKYYGEITITTAGGTLFFVGVGNRNDYLAHYTEENPLSKIEGGYIRSDTGQGYTAFGDTGTYRTYGSSYTTNDIIGIAVDVDKGAVWISKNNTWYNSASASEIENGDVSNSLVTGVTGPLILLNYTHNGTTLDYNFGQKGFEYTPPTGYKAIQQDNLPETEKGVSGFTWLKDRDNSTNHYLVDSSRNYKNALYSNSTGAEVFLTAGLRNPLKGGFEVLDGDPVNGSGRSFVSWNWVANSGITASNTDGSITSTVQANQTAGFSIVQYTGTGSNATIGHGLSSAPELIILKRLVGVQDWLVGNTASGWTKHLFLNGNDALATASTTWNNTAPTSSVFSVGTVNSSNKSGDPFIGYVWHGVDGFSKIGSYTGNGSTDGTFVYTGFVPRFLIIKRTNTTGGWFMLDTVRQTFNPNGTYHEAQRATAEDNQNSTVFIDFVSNGFKIRGTSSAINTSSSTYIYMAFAEHPFVGDGTSPVTAR